MSPQLILVHYNQGLDQSWPLHPAPPSLLRLRYGRDIRPPTHHISLPLTLLQPLAFYTATTGQSTKILMKSYHCSNLQKSYCKFMSPEFTKGIVSLLSTSSTYQFETTFKDGQTVNNRTIKALKAEQSSDVQQTKDITKPICSTKQTWVVALTSSSANESWVNSSATCSMKEHRKANFDKTIRGTLVAKTYL